ncbi:hypothetical protein vseg_000771 [Gypsophila vaccaria]
MKIITLLLISLFLATNIHSFALQSNPIYGKHLLQFKGGNNGTSIGNAQKQEQDISSQNQVGCQGNKMYHNMKRSGRGGGGRGRGGGGLGGAGAGIANHHPTNKKKNGASTNSRPLKYVVILSFAYAYLLFGLIL